MITAKVGDIWYRYEDVRYAAGLDEFDNPIGSGRTAVNLYEYKVKKVTPKGVWLDTGRFVLMAAIKRYACPTTNEAMESFIARKERQLVILNTRAQHVREALNIAKGERLAA